MSPGLEELLAQLESMPALLEAAAEALTGCERVRPAAGGFSLLEQAWHLADLEREGYGERIARLRTGGRPELPDFEGDRIASERRYQELDLTDALASFRVAREQNVTLLRSLTPVEWQTEGVQQDVGLVRLSDVPRMMADHDRGHREEIAALRAELRR